MRRTTPRDGSAAPPASGSGSVGRYETAVAVLRLLLVAVVLIGERTVDRGRPDTGPFAVLLVAYALVGAGLLALHVRQLRRRRPPANAGAVEPAFDLVAITALAYTSGGAFSQVRLAFFALPILAAVQLRPLLTAMWALAATVAYVLLSVVHPATRSADAETVLVHALYLAWAGAGAVVVSATLAARDRRIRADARAREQLVEQALGAEDRERRRLAELLHDDVVQYLLAGRQELHEYHRHHDEAAYGHADAALATSIERLRGEISTLHPYVLDHAGLRAALDGHAQAAARRAGAVVAVDVPSDLPGGHDGLILSLGRELLANAARHAAARRIELRLAREGREIVLVVRDDGRGFDATRRADAVAGGHIGLATSAARVAAVGGSLAVDSAPGAGTTVTARLPV